MISKTQTMTRISLFAGLQVAAAVILRFGGEAVVPFSIVPLVIFLSAFVLGGKAGAASVLVYVMLGLVGLPVFAGAPYGGLTYVLKPTFGFLLGFAACAWVAGSIGIETPLRRVAAVCLGIGALYAIGLIYFYLVFNFHLQQPVTFSWVIKVAAAPFILLDIAKACLAIYLAKSLQKNLKGFGLV